MIRVPPVLAIRILPPLNQRLSALAAVSGRSWPNMTVLMRAMMERGIAQTVASMNADQRRQFEKLAAAA